MAKGIKTQKFTAPSTGKIINVAVDGDTIVPLDKVNIYARGKVNSVKKELRTLQRFKQTQRKIFDVDPQNEINLQRLKNRHHNWERSADMNNNLESIGLTDTPTNNEKIINHLLEVGQNKVTPDNYQWVPSVLEGANGKLQVNSSWKILDDGRKYMTTLRFKPIE